MSIRKGLKFLNYEARPVICKFYLNQLSPRLHSSTVISYNNICISNLYIANSDDYFKTLNQIYVISLEDEKQHTVFNRMLKDAHSFETVESNLRMLTSDTVNEVCITDDPDEYMESFQAMHKYKPLDFIQFEKFKKHLALIKSNYLLMR